MPAAPRKDWTLLIFMAGDNNLDPEGERDLQQLKSVDMGGRVNIVVQFDRAEAGRSTRRYALRHGSSLVSDVVDSLGETNTGDPAVLTDFLKWGLKEYPAKHVMAVIWNHGGGADDTDPFAAARPGGTRRRGPVAPPRRRSRSFFSHRRTGTAPTAPAARPRRQIAGDEQALDFLDNVELQKVMSAAAATLGRPLDILGMDACLMSMVEVAWQLRDSVTFTIGSQENEPGEGWPYDTILQSLAAAPDMKPAELAGVIVQRYTEHFSDNAQITQSACSMARLKPLVSACEALATALQLGLGNRLFQTTVTSAGGKMRRFANPDYADLHSLCDCLAAEINDAGVRDACLKVQTALAKTVIASGGDASGLSIYFPQTARVPSYALLDFPRDSRWGPFLEQFIPRLQGS